MAILAVLTVLDVFDAAPLIPFIIAAFVILAKIGNVKKKKILSVISFLLSSGALCLCLFGPAVVLEDYYCDEWIIWVNFLWYGCYSFISIGVIISNCFSKENNTKIVKFATAILVSPMVLFFLRILLDCWYYYEYLLLWVVEEVLAILTIPLVIPAIIFFALYIMGRKTIFCIEYAGGYIKFDASIYSSFEVHEFQKRIRIAQDELKGVL